MLIRCDSLRARFLMLMPMWFPFSIESARVQNDTTTYCNIVWRPLQLRLPLKFQRPSKKSKS